MDSRLLTFALALLLCVGLAQPAHAQFLNQAADWAQKYWWRNCASLDMDFVHDQYYINGNTTCDGSIGTQYTAGSGNTGVVNFIAGTGATFTRAGTTNITDSNPPFYLDTSQGEAFVSRASVTNNVTPTGAPFYICSLCVSNPQSWVSRADTTDIATYFNGSGNLTTVTSPGAARNAAYYYNGSSWVLGGTLIEPTATNSIRNNTMVGAVAGTPGTLPTNWTLFNYGGVTSSVVGTGTEDGITYVDVAFSGTVSGSFYLTLDSASATPGQTWTSSAFLKLTSGSLTNVSQAYLRIQDASSSAGLTVANANLSPIGSGALSASRYSVSETIPDVAAIKVATLIYFNGSGTINFTLRIGMPQMELNPYSTASTGYATSVIATSGSTVTRAADIYNQQPASYFDSTGTLYFSAANTARTNYVYSGGSWVGGGTLNSPATTNTLIEPAATNSVTNNTMQGAVPADGIERTNNGTFSTTSPSVCSGSVTTGGNTLTCNNGSGTGWVGTINGGSGSVTAASGSMTLAGDGTNAASIYEAIPTTSGYTYILAVTTGTGNAVTVQVGTSVGGSSLFSATANPASATYYYQFNATSSTSYVQINNTGATAATVMAVSVQSGGYAPPGWGIFHVAQGLVASIADTGTYEGVDVIDVHIYGLTTSASAYEIDSQGNGDNGVAASPGQAWTHEMYTQIISDSSSISNMVVEVGQFSSTWTATGSRGTSPNLAPTRTQWQRAVATISSTAANTAYVRPDIQFSGWSPGTSVSFTVRIGMPQMEQSSYATSVIPTYGSAVTRTADVYSVPSGGTYYNSAGVIKMAPANTPRLDYGPGGGNYPLGVLIEESRANLVEYSSYYQSPWALSGTTATNTAATAPDSSNTAILLQEDTSTGSHYMNQPLSGTAGTTYTYSLFMKNYSADRYISFYMYDSTDGNFAVATVNPANGVVENNTEGTVTTQQLTNGWYRVSISGTPTVTSFGVYAKLVNGTNYSYTGDGTSGNYIWGLQLEAGAFPTSYIPTSGSVVTRAADVFTLPATAGPGSGWYAGPPGTLHCIGEASFVTGNISDEGLCGIDDGTSANTVSLKINNPYGYPALMVYSGGATALQQNASTTPCAAYSICDIIAPFQNGAQSVSANGLAAIDTHLATLPTVDRLNIGHTRGTSGPLDGWVNRVTYFPIIHPDASLPGFTNY